ncbi:hypothetical protein FHG64_06245 [Antarcticibacterium flavum]|uniref:Methylamine utilisation protein MauE domain-containing protein n=1 Tax=Antarcticibacterium flavum TaxID=2058175 RepID=A0A5B7X102_9FLAO|nr:MULTISPECIES: MauE/DoxX family redox-associated membrane protein [Antarcticibacterium]MCM4161594.1 hypothetical protein [Antarcticibacterium sp. W02-3]QCY69037.1 hypothetical protein FHG64_06245 [Antarcticibacterium flavum]
MKTSHFHKYQLIGVEAICIFFIILFMYAGLTKLLDGSTFYANILNIPQLEDKTIASIVSIIIPLLEIIAALLIVWPKTRLKGLYVVFGLFIVFTGYLFWIIFLSPYTPCSCGSILTLLSWNQHLLLNVICMGLVIIGITFLKKKKKSIRKISHNRLTQV